MPAAPPSLTCIFFQMLLSSANIGYLALLQPAAQEPAQCMLESRQTHTGNVLVNMHEYACVPYVNTLYTTCLHFTEGLSSFDGEAFGSACPGHGDIQDAPNSTAQESCRRSLSYSGMLHTCAPLLPPNDAAFAFTSAATRHCCRTTPAGFFKAHRDTPASLDIFGSLIFCLPTEFTGGELIIRSPDLSTSVTHDWGSTSSARLAAAASSSSGCMLAWAAMYSDCEHEIKPVTTGHRVTLTYRLYQPVSRCQDRGNEAAATAPAAAAAASESAFGVQLAAALSDATWYPAGVTLGLALEHFYAAQTLAMDECEPRHSGYYSNEDYDDSRNMPDSIEPDSLKGADLQLYRAARAFGLEVMVVPVVSLEKFHKYDLTYLSDEEDGLSPLSPGKLAVMRSFKDHPGDGDWDPNGEWDGEQYTDGESWEEYLQRNIAKRCAAQISGDLLWVKPPGKQHLKYCGNVSKYTGNTGVSTCYYVAGALLLMVPPVGAAARQG